MLRGVAAIFGHPAAGWTCAAAAAVTAAALGASAVQMRHEEAFLKGRIAALAMRDASQLQTELASCRATARSYAAALSASVPRPLEAARKLRPGGQGGDAVAAELVSNPPAGFDVCARMESADRAVLNTLGRR